MALLPYYGTAYLWSMTDRGFTSTSPPNFFNGQSVDSVYSRLYSIHPYPFSGTPFTAPNDPPWPTAIGQPVDPMQPTNLLAGDLDVIKLPADGEYEAAFSFGLSRVGFISSNNTRSGSLTGEVLHNGSVIFTHTRTVPLTTGSSQNELLPDGGFSLVGTTYFVQFSGLAGDEITLRITNNISITENSPVPGRTTGLLYNNPLLQVLWLMEGGTASSPTVTTAASAAEAEPGVALHDVATLAGGNSPTGRIVFDLYGPDDNDCEGAPIFSDEVAVSGNGDYTSGDYTPLVNGTYRWVANYLGDTQNAPTANGCNEAGESTVVAPIVFQGFQRMNPDATLEWQKLDGF